MNRQCWWLVELLSRCLQPNEREAVLGDLSESGETGGQAMCQVLGLVMRRQAALWTNWRAWLAVVFAGIFFCTISRWLAFSSAIYLWLYTNYWSPTILESATYRHDFFQYVLGSLLGCAVLAGIGWSSGFALGSLSRRSLSLNGATLVMFVGDCLAAAPRHSVNAAVFEHAFYRIIFPLLVQISLILLPCVWGMHRGMRVLNQHKENHV